MKESDVPIECAPFIIVHTRPFGDTYPQGPQEETVIHDPCDTYPPGPRKDNYQ